MNTFSPRQVQCMQVMGLVPWVRRVVVESVVVEPAGQSVSPQSGTDIKIEGDTNARVLLIFSNAGTQASWPLGKADDALLDGMLRAIGLSKSDICTCCLAAEADLARVEPTSSRQQFLYFGASEIADTDLELQCMTLKDGMHSGWQLPTLELLRNEPQRKRHAWLTLKQLRAKLDQ